MSDFISLQDISGELSRLRADKAALQRRVEELEAWLLDIAKAAGRDVPDAIDNDGLPYQSQSFSEWIDKAINSNKESS